MARTKGSKNKVKKVEVVKHDNVDVEIKKISNGYLAEITCEHGLDDRYEEIQVFSKSNAGIRRMVNKLVREKLA